MIALTRMTFRDTLQQLRADRKLTQAGLATVVGVDIGSIRHWEQGRRIPSVPALVKLAKSLGVPLDTFADCDDFNPSPDDPQ